MNESQPQITKAIVFAYFAHQATPMERQQIESWLKTKEGVETYFTYLDEWERQFPQFQANLEEASAKFAVFVRKEGERTIPDAEQEELAAVLPIAEKSQALWLQTTVFRWAVAASAVLLVGLWLAKDLWYYKRLTSPQHEMLSIRLQDGSEVQLGANSSLKYPRFWFGHGTRYVWLDGDAEFKVAHLANAGRFIVYTPDQTAIEVLGTEFRVNCRQQSTRVLLRTGRIKLTNPMAAQPLILKPGDLVTVTDEKKIRKEQFLSQPDEQNRQVRNFLFQSTPLNEVAEQLNDVYGIKVHVTQPAILNRTVSGTFQAETAEDLLEAISEMMKLELEETSDGYRLRQPIQ